MKADLSGKTITVGLIIDEMAIRQHVNGEKYHGYVDFGAGDDTGNTSVAKDAFLFLLTSIDESWKIPCGILSC